MLSNQANADSRETAAVDGAQVRQKSHSEKPTVASVTSMHVTAAATITFLICTYPSVCRYMHSQFRQAVLPELQSDFTEQDWCAPGE